MFHQPVSDSGIDAFRCLCYISDLQSKKSSLIFNYILLKESILDMIIFSKGEHT